MEIQLFDVPHGLEVSRGNAAHVWSPHDNVSGHVVVLGVNIKTISVSLLGHIRVWVLSSQPHELPSIASSSYKFLHQTADVAGVTKADVTADGVPMFIVPFSLGLPPACVPKSPGIPSQCLNLPPTMTVGDVLRGPNKEEYAQPKIKYTLRAIVHSHEDELVTADKEITVLPRSEPSPPINTSDFPSEFVDMAVNTISFSRFGHSYSMTMSLQEPSPITLSHPRQHVTSQLMLDVVIRTFSGGAKGPSLQGLPQNLKNLTFNLQPIFRAKTFCSIKPFPQIPSQTMVDPIGPIRLHDSILKLPEQTSEAHSWEQQLINPASLTSKDMNSKPSGFSSAATQKGIAGVTESWTSHIEFPIRIEHNLSPSFCAAVASRQYSIIGRVRVKGAHVSEFILECPVQVNYFLSAPKPPHYSDRTNGQGTNARRQGSHGLDGSVDFVIDQDDPPPYSNE